MTEDRWNRVNLVVAFLDIRGEYQTHDYVLDRKEIEEEYRQQAEAQDQPLPEDWELVNFEQRVLEEAQKLTSRPIVQAGKTEDEIVVVPATSITGVTIQILERKRLVLTN